MKNFKAAFFSLRIYSLVKSLGKLFFFFFCMNTFQSFRLFQKKEIIAMHRQRGAHVIELQ